MKWFALGAVLLVATSARAGSYSVTVLDQLPGRWFSEAFGVGPNGQVVGAAGFSFEEAVTWSPDGRLTSLGYLPGGTYSQAYAINGAGQIAGYSAAGGVSRATLYGLGQAPQDLGTLPGDDRSRANAINESGQVAGYSWDTTQTFGAQHAFRWSAGAGMVRLAAPDASSSTIARGINDQGQVVGNSTGTSRTGAAFWDTDGSLTTFGGLGASAADVNDLGQAVGSYYAVLPGPSHAFLWTKTNGLADLGTLAGYGASFATSINDQGAVVGYAQNVGTYRAFLWTPGGGMVDLNSLIDPSSGFVLENATGINDAGQIVGYGTYNNTIYQSFLLNPVPEPTSLAALALGGLGLLRRRVRRA